MPRETPAPDWSDIRDIIAAGRPAQGAARLAEAAAPWRLAGETLCESDPPDAVARAGAFIETGRHASWFDTRLPALAEEGWTAALFTLGWRRALRHDLQGAADYAAAVTGHASAAPEAIAPLLGGGGRFLNWLAYDLSRRLALQPVPARPAGGPLYFRGDMNEVGVVGGAEFTERGFGL